MTLPDYVTDAVIDAETDVHMLVDTCWIDIAALGQRIALPAPKAPTLRVRHIDRKNGTSPWRFLVPRLEVLTPAFGGDGEHELRITYGLDRLAWLRDLGFRAAPVAVPVAHRAAFEPFAKPLVIAPVVEGHTLGDGLAHVNRLVEAAARLRSAAVAA